MTRTENDLRAALRELEQRADQQGAPSTASILAATTDDRLTGRGRSASPRLHRWLPPVAAAAVVAATAATAVTLSGQHSGPDRIGTPQPGGQPAGGHTSAHRTSSASRHTSAPRHTSAAPKAVTPDAGSILADAAAKLAAADWSTPDPQDFFYVHTTDATTWTSVSGRQPGESQAPDAGKIITTPVPACRGGQIVSSGESGPCTLNDVPHYLDDAPTVPAAWDAYLEQMAPGAKAGHAQGKIIVQVLHEDLVAPKAAAALLRYTASSCPGLHTVDVQPVSGEALIGVTCTSMTNGSYALVFDAASHQLAGFVGVTGNGAQDGSAEIIRQTGVVPAIGRTP